MCLHNLQRISVGYLLASMAEIWLVNNDIVDSATAFVKKYYIQWLVWLEYIIPLVLMFFTCNCTS